MQTFYPETFDESDMVMYRIYAVRLGLTTYYSYRTSTVQSNLDVLQKQREATIDKLKTATKYNTTQELLKKYGGTPTPKGRPQGSSTPKPSPNSAALKGGRTAGVPPPTANIPGRNLSTSFQSTPERSGVALQRPLGGNSSLSPTSSTLPRQQLSTFSDESADFAPNAFSSSPQYVQPDQGSRWYDRIMDVLLGEDEMLPKNRLALICSHCRLVNGQASPGVKRLEDVGKWRCSGCGIMNGQETDAEKIVANIKDQASSGIEKSNVYLNSGKISGDDATMSKEANVNGGHESDVTQYSENSEVESGKVEIAEEKVPEPLVEDEPPRRRVGRPKGSGKKAN